MAVDSVAMKLPTFWVSSPAAWFAQAEAQFALRKITVDETKYMYYHVVAALDTNTATRALSVLTAPPQENKYQTIKSFLSPSYGLTEEERATTLLNMRGLGDAKPSELMDNMLSLLGEHRPCFLFKQFFMQQLPDYVRSSLANSTCKDYRALAQEADKLFIAAKHPSSSTFHERLNAAVCDEVDQIVEETCWYHRRYGLKAKKCHPNCQHFNKVHKYRKRQGGPSVATASAGPRDPQLFITDNTGRRLLLDTGAQVSVIPTFDKNAGPYGPPLQAANGTPIQTYRSRELHLCFNNRLYEARLFIADVKRPLLGADLFREHNLLVDLRGQRLIEGDTFLPPPPPPLLNW